MSSVFRRLAASKDERGASAVEYGLLVAAIAALIVIIVFALGGVVKQVFSSTCTQLGSNVSGASTASCNG